MGALLTATPRSCTPDNGIAATVMTTLCASSNNPPPLLRRRLILSLHFRPRPALVSCSSPVQWPGPASTLKPDVGSKAALVSALSRLQTAASRPVNERDMLRTKKRGIELCTGVYSSTPSLLYVSICHALGRDILLFHMLGEQPHVN